MEVQSYLRKCGLSPKEAVAKLETEFGIETTFHPTLPLVILNYSQISSPKLDPISRECRGLTLELGTWKVVSRSFKRFFNAGESPDLERNFDWSNFCAESKEDGSLILLFYYDGAWRVNTRGSFAQHPICPGFMATWSEVVFSLLSESGLSALPKTHTYVFELVGPLNKIVRTYNASTLFLLSAFVNESGNELKQQYLDLVADILGVRRPQTFEFKNLSECVSYLEAHDDPTFEGLVLVDAAGMRLKVKSSRYVALHHLHNNGAVVHPKNLLNLVLRGEADEVLLHFNELAPQVYDMVGRLGAARARTEAVWSRAKSFSSQKEFASYVIRHSKPTFPVLFEARKQGSLTPDLWVKFERFLLKAIEANAI